MKKEEETKKKKRKKVILHCYSKAKIIWMKPWFQRIYNLILNLKNIITKKIVLPHYRLIIKTILQQSIMNLLMTLTKTIRWQLILIEIMNIVKEIKMIQFIKIMMFFY